jgi:hypothetical protein
LYTAWDADLRTPFAAPRPEPRTRGRSDARLTSRILGWSLVWWQRRMTADD